MVVLSLNLTCLCFSDLLYFGSSLWTIFRTPNVCILKLNAVIMTDTLISYLLSDKIAYLFRRVRLKEKLSVGHRIFSQHPWQGCFYRLSCMTLPSLSNLPDKNNFVTNSLKFVKRITRKFLTIKAARSKQISHTKSIARKNILMAYLIHRKNELWYRLGVSLFDAFAQLFSVKDSWILYTTN